MVAARIPRRYLTRGRNIAEPPHAVAVMLFRFLKFSTVVPLVACLCLLQVGRQAFAQTGKSYSSEAQRPANPAPQFPSPITFTDMTNGSGINFKHNASPTPSKYLLETMGAGVALIDYDNDGRLDVFLTNGAQVSDPMPAGRLPDKSD